MHVPRGRWQRFGLTLISLLIAACAGEVMARLDDCLFAGMSLPTMLRYWQKWPAKFQPGIVLIYPSPQFYLDNESPRALTPRPELEDQSRPTRSRFLERLMDTAKQTELLKALRVRLTL